MTATLDLETMIGSGSVVPAFSGAPLSAGTPKIDPAPGARYQLPRTIVEDARGAAGQTVTAPAVFESVLLSSDLVDHFVSLAAEELSRDISHVESLADVLEVIASTHSSMRRASRHPAYRQLLAMPAVAVPVALSRLSSSSRPLWLHFLQNAVAARPAAGATTIDDAATAWRTWGEQRGLCRD